MEGNREKKLKKVGQPGPLSPTPFSVRKHKPPFTNIYNTKHPNGNIYTLKVCCPYLRSTFVYLIGSQMDIVLFGSALYLMNVTTTI